MKIIRHGDPRRKRKVFGVRYCGCVFGSDFGECKDTLLVIGHIAECPCRHKDVSSRDVRCIRKEEVNETQ